MNKFFVLVFAFILISSFFLTPLSKGFYKSHDGEPHVVRIGAYYKALNDFQVPPRWAGDLNYRYGSPVFIFFNPLPDLLGSLLHLSGLSLEDSFKGLVIISFIFAPVSFYLWISRFVSNEIAFVSALLYGFSPYHFLDVYVRGDIGEIVSFVFIPLILFFLERSFKEKSIFPILLGGATYGFLILSHSGISLLFSPVLFIYSIIRSRNQKFMIRSFSIFVLGLLFSSFFWLPALYESKYVAGKTFIGDMFSNHFPTLSQLVYSPWGFSPDVAKQGGLSLQVGPLYIVLVFLSAFALFGKKIKEVHLALFWLLIFFISIFMSLSVSSFIWEKISLLKLLEFPWRFGALSSFSAVALIAFGISSFNDRKLLVCISLFCLLLSLSFLKTQFQHKKDDNYYLSSYSKTYFFREASPIWTAGDPYQPPKAPIELISGRGSIQNVQRKSNSHTFEMSASEPVRILDNTLYFPGWQATVDDKKVPIEFQDINHRGLITFSVPQGLHAIKVVFKESPIRLFSDILSFISVFGFFVGGMFFHLMKRKLHE